MTLTKEKINDQITVLNDHKGAVIQAGNKSITLERHDAIKVAKRLLSAFNDGVVVPMSRGFEAGNKAGG